MAQAPKRLTTLFVGQAPVGEFIEKKTSDRLDFKYYADTIEDVWAGRADNSIGDDLECIICLDDLYDPTGRDESFENFVGTMAPFCIVLIVQYSPDLENDISNAVNRVIQVNGQGDGFFRFVPTRKTAQYIFDALEDYRINGPQPSIVAALNGEDYVAPVEELNEHELEAARIRTESPLIEKQKQTDSLGRVIAVTSSKGGSGKSTVALSLATYIAQASESAVRQGLEKRKLRVALIDLDVRDGQIGFITGHLEPSVMNIMRKGISEQSLKETVRHMDRMGGVDLILAAKRPRTADDIPPEFYAELIQLMKIHYDFIILDTSVSYTDPLLEHVAYPMADNIVFVTDIVVNSVYSMTRWIQEVTNSPEKKGMGIPKSKIGIVVNKSMANINMGSEKILSAAQDIPIITIIPNNAKIVAFVVNNQSIERLLTQKEMRDAFRRLALSVTGRFYKLGELEF